MQSPVHAGVDLGAGSGRVLVGGFSDGVFLEEAHRFGYAPRPSAGHLRWDFTRLVDGMLDGLCRAASVAGARDLAVRSVGVDSWGVDYGLVDDEGDLVEEPICYRDNRTEGMMERAFAQVSREALFRETGVQVLPFNTIFQLMAHVREGLPAGGERLLMIPDLCHQALCGASTGEPTNASTTQLLNLATADWDDRLFSELDLPRHLMPRLRPSGTTLGPLRDHLRERLQFPDAVVVQPATHDTASAVAGMPLAPGWAFISSGTWSLVGVERTAPLVEPAVLAANFTNERGVGGTFRFLKNVAGLWILECCRREWQTSGRSVDLPRLLAEAAALGQPQGLVYPDDPRFFNPPSMLRELGQALTETGQRVPATPAEWTRVVLDSLACRYASLIDTLEGLTGQPLAGIHIVGGGARNEYLNQATASAAGRPVLAGPVEATALGNILVQAVACGITTLAEGRRRIAEAYPPAGSSQPTPWPDGRLPVSTRRSNGWPEQRHELASGGDMDSRNAAKEGFSRREFVAAAGTAAVGALFASPTPLDAQSKRRYAIVGTGVRAVGMWGRPLIQQYGDVVAFVGLSDPNPLRLETAKRMMGASCPTFTSFDQMMDEARPDLLMVTTVDSYHSEYIVKALDRGVDVITEKPMVVDEKQCQAVLDAEHRNKRNIIVTFNYRYAPKHQKIKELLAAGEIGRVTSVDFSWYLDTSHGADYFRRWHAFREKSGSLWVHKATHHFDLINWWLDADPVHVSAEGSLLNYGKAGPFRHTHCRPCPYKAKCGYHWDITRSQNLVDLYVNSESADGYLRDGCVYRENINIFDTMNAVVKYSTGVSMSYSVSTFLPIEGYRVAFNGTKGRLEVRDYEGQPWKPEEPTEMYLIRNFGKREKIEIPTAAGGHGGGDQRLRDLIFRKVEMPSYMQLPGSRAGAMSCLTGIAARKSCDEGKPIRIADLVRLSS